MKNSGKGFSLIEVMVSLVIMVIGLIGIFNLHIVAKRGSFESFQQTQASYYANDIISRMKLNSSQLASYGSSSGVGTQYSGTPTTPGTACTGAATCTPAQMAAWDLFEWRAAFTGQAEVVNAQNVGGLDTPTACIQVNGNNVTVVMSWRGIRSTSDSELFVGCGSANDRRRVYSIQTVII
ncbi:type IV pilus modification protein PilV [Shewanella colwelliana]|uniref:Type IV pilus modification protein PilV n=1 Tax=Shewanella colwelliana TaxID=23 RepID=A0ABQ4P305_SHECO|nr:type IV pilus modification protein PilV [Shewanella colwelliana]MDX1280580.1 type IV pilus modification protein PilV [Shewanella colwelliana]GIU41903.1 type IV pilus modification protein PilV [Shewanella colwelliana]